MQSARAVNGNAMKHRTNQSHRARVTMESCRPCGHDAISKGDSCHRTPRIIEFSEDRTRVLVRFTAMSWSGESFGGTCLYLKREERWGAYTIRPNQSQSIAMAEAWLVKRNWISWG